ncbi:MAG: ABC transporter ATP-binding protein [Gemmatimonadota bacterium]|nr:ABC transporter ATP-binding protein [Gemmatimonadota bacterium]
MSPPPAIQTRGLGKVYRLGFLLNRRVRALHSLDLTIRQGEVFGLLGPNGAGKSTTIKILLNLVRASTGEALIFGHPPHDPKARSGIGFLPENPAPYEYLTGREFIRLGAALAGMPRAEIERRCSEVLEQVGMTRSADIQIRRYSKGMIQRVALAHAIVHRPRLLVLDEPTSGLDPVGRRQMRDLILAERTRGTTILFCTHIIPDVEALCDRVAVLVGGRLVREGSVADLLTGQSEEVELTIQGLGVERLRAMAPPATQIHELGGRVVVRLAEADQPALLNQVLQANGRLTRLQPVRFTLEDLFLQAIQEAGPQSVGGQIG